MEMLEGLLQARDQEPLKALLEVLWIVSLQTRQHLASKHDVSFKYPGPTLTVSIARGMLGYLVSLW